MLQRSALAYASTYSGAESVCRRVHVGVSTSSTTSRSTNKTGSSPYRSDTHLRHTSTSTSNYNSDRDPYMSSRSHRSALHSRQGIPWSNSRTYKPLSWRIIYEPEWTSRAARNMKSAARFWIRLRRVSGGRWRKELGSREFSQLRWRGCDVEVPQKHGSFDTATCRAQLLAQYPRQPRRTLEHTLLKHGTLPKY